VNAKDKATSREQSIRIEGSGGLARGEIERMIRDAEAHAGEDKAKREAIEKHNTLDSMVYQAEKTLTDNADKIPAAEKQAAETAIAEAKQALEANQPAALDAAQQRLEQSLHKVAEALYKAQASGAPGGAQEAPKGSGSDGDVVDAEYTEEKGDA
jgi:molecular chaperone DnaK